MRSTVVIVLAALLLGALLPPALPYLALAGSMPMLGDLDVCHSAAPALSTSGEMPYLAEACCRPLPLVAVMAPESIFPVLAQSPYLSQTERPPKA